MASRSLRRGREGAWPPVGSRWQVPRPTEVPFAADYLGRRGDVVLFQGTIEDGATRLVHAEPVSFAEREAGVGGADRVDNDTGQQLVQEPKTTRQSQ